MLGGRIIALPFDGSSKRGWLSADLSAVLELTTVIMLLLCMVSLILAGIFSEVDTLLKWLLWEQTLAAFAVPIAPAAVIAVYIVFVRRCNPFVTGGQRQFRYICRWL